LRRVRALAAALGAAAVAAAIASASPSVEPIAKIPVGAQSGMVLSAAASVWTSDLLSGRVIRIDPATNAVSRRIAFSTRPFGLAYGAGSVWVADRSANVLGRIDPLTNRVVKKITIGFGSYGVAFGAGSVWVTSEADGTVRRISAKKNRVVARSRWARPRTAWRPRSARSGSPIWGAVRSCGSIRRRTG